MHFDHARYEFLQPLGRGGQGLALRVRDREHPQRALVAKIVEGSFRQDAVAQEFARLSRLQIPGVVRATDLGWINGKPFLVEELARGVTPERFVDAASSLLARRERFVLVFGNLLDILANLHDAGFVHGDLKPEHMLVAEDGSVTLIDLGAAVLRGRALASYTQAFAAPEILAGGPASARSDVFSLGRSMAFVATRTLAERSIRRSATWLDAREHELVEQCLAPHPFDRPATAEVALRALGRTRTAGEQCAFVGRELELERCVAQTECVLHVVGAPGCGKSRLLAEVAARARLAGISVRAFCLPEELHSARDCLNRLARFFRGEPHAWPFLAPAMRDCLIVLDGLDHAGPDLRHALDVYRCSGAAGPRVLVAGDTSPAGATTLALGPLTDHALRAAVSTVDGLQKIDEALLAAQGNPGLLLGMLGVGRASAAALLARTKSLSGHAHASLALLALAGGSLARALAFAEFELGALELIELGFVESDGQRYALAHPAQAEQLAETLGSLALANACAHALLEQPGTPDAIAMCTLATGAFVPEQRSALLACAATQFEHAGESAREHAALTQLLADRTARRAIALVRYERLSREIGSPLHREALAWLEAAAHETPALATLAKRRRIEADARAGEHAAATLALTELMQVDAGALVQSTRAMLALLRGDWQMAQQALESASNQMAGIEDEEELARMEHNRGIVLLYRGGYAQAAVAMQLSAARKKRLGDRAGVRASLLNLGLAQTKLANFSAAFAALSEACALATTLGQGPGLAWCLAAKAEAEIRAGKLDCAERTIAQIAALEIVLPAAVQTDLQLLRCEIEVLHGRGARALAWLAEVPVGDDTLTDAKACELRARAHLASLPCDRRRAARLALQAIRHARAGAHHDIEVRAGALLMQLRGPKRAQATPHRNAVLMVPTEAPIEFLPLTALEAIARGADRHAAFLKPLLARTKAERAFVCALGEDAGLHSAFGLDRDGFALQGAQARVDLQAIRAALQQRDLVYQRAVDFAGESGSRLCIAAPEPSAGLLRAVLVLEHRFREGAFDSLADGAAMLAHFAALAQLVLHAELAGNAHAAAGTQHLAGARSETSSYAREAPPSPLTTWTANEQRRRVFPSIVGESAALNRALFKLDLAADSALPVLLTGETGVGKELFARALHDTGARRDKPFVAVNCGAIADSLFESELFGHVRGAFTGADKERAGLLVKAEGGTLFLDEIGELPLARQAALLRTLESKRVRAVGSDREQPFDVRIVSATNRNLENQVAKGLFREDLLFRLNVVPIVIPPLRDRKDDIALLVQATCSARALSVQFSDAAFALICRYDFPGNVRELTHLLERLSLHRGVIESKQLPRELRANGELAELQARTPSRHSPAAAREVVAEGTQKREIANALAQTHGNITHAAAALGITRHGLKKRMMRLGLREKS